MKPWTQRPFEVRNLFNPAFCGVVLARAIEGHETECQLGLPYSLAHLVLPLSLHKSTREILAQGNRSHLLKVLEVNPQILIGLPERAIEMRSFTQEGFGLLAQKDCLKVSDDGRIELVPRTVTKTVKGTAEAKEIQNVAKYLGKQFARISDRTTIFSTLGVRP
ncbi:three component ABC system middle component [Phaeobacter sp. 11ANDIMAR09]|uniref:three component ABC system middle component n=1 Tax=Phaeobacter sp. 11ANDIMAR09 TaxID=1225647 RepID=UPI0006C8C959|nr:three component ABC system middle component [Phaeobacter sp. 11ANDIMAR09]